MEAPVRMKREHPVIAAALAAVVWSAGLSVQADSSRGQNGGDGQRFDLALIGDFPYADDQQPKWLNVIADINRSGVSFVVHDGDFKSGSSLCSDETFQNRYEEFQTFRVPFIFVFGDNEWTDCHRANNGGYDPIERLDRLRQLFTVGDRSLGRRTLKLERQSNDPAYAKFRENVRWSFGGVAFVGLNVPGSNNNLGRTPAADAEYVERNAANLAWLRSTFAKAAERDARAVMVVIQANPGFELPPEERTGFNDFLDLLQELTLAFGRPVALVHGDNHNFQINKPMFGATSGRRIENFTRVETFGSPDVHWLRVTVDPRRRDVFSFTQEIVPDNLVSHLP